jgi:nitrogen fixation-related uncharacterized protein
MGIFLTIALVIIFSVFFWAVKENSEVNEYDNK